MRKIALAAIMGMTLSACLKDKTIEPAPPPPAGPCADTVFFTADLMTEIFNPSCNISGCHNSTSASAGYVLDNHSQIAAGSANILKALKHEPGASPMPAGSPKLADSLIQKLECWIDQGKLNN